MPWSKIIGDQMGADLAVGFGFEFVALGEQFGAQLAEILDDAVMDDGDALGGVGMGVALRRLAMRGPAGVADAGMAGKRMFAAAPRPAWRACPARGGARSAPSTSVAMPAES